MLVLSRKKEEEIRIGDEITIKVISIKGGVIRLGIDAPKAISIVRSELLSGFETCVAVSPEVASTSSPVATAS
jgi:carbon storage regulator